MNQRFSITPANAAKDMRIPDSVYRTLSIIGIFGDENGWCWPSQKTIANLRGVSRQTVNAHIKLLIKLSYLNIHPRYDKETGAQRSNKMQIKFDFAPEAQEDLTPPVKSKTLHPQSSPEVDTPHQAQDFTHNDLLNDPTERKDIYSKPTSANGSTMHSGEYLLPEVKAIVEAITNVVQEQYWDEDIKRINEAAHKLNEDGYIATDVEEFPAWWKTYGNYTGYPALKSLMSRWKEYKNVPDKIEKVEIPQVERVWDGTKNTYIQVAT